MRNIGLLFAFVGLTVGFMHFIELPFLGGLFSTLGLILLPALIGFFGAIIFRGGMVTKTALPLTIYPLAVAIYRFVILESSPRDVEADAFILVVVVGVTVYVAIIAAITAAWIIMRQRSRS